METGEDPPRSPKTTGFDRPGRAANVLTRGALAQAMQCKLRGISIFYESKGKGRPFL